MASNCAICETTFESNNPLKRYCSKPCYLKGKKLAEQARLGKAVCETCNNEFQPKSQPDPAQGRLNKFCSAKCRCESPEWKAARAKKYLTAGTGEKAFSLVSFINCKVCNTLFTTRNAVSRLCSPQCKATHKEQCKETNRAVSASYSLSKHIPKTITCKECQTLFTTNYRDKRKGYCSTQCAAKANNRIAKAKYGSKHRERAKHFGCYYEPVNVLKVFARDKWTCQICGIKTPKSLKGTVEPRYKSGFFLLCIFA